MAVITRLILGASARCARATSHRTARKPSQNARRYFASQHDKVRPPPRPRRLIVALGNPGQKYEHTRHNIGFMVADHFISRYVPRMQASCQGVEAAMRPKFNGLLLKTTTEFRVHPSSELGLDLVDQRSSRRRQRTIEEKSALHNKVHLSVLLPQTYMNLSGLSVGKFIRSERFRIPARLEGPNFGDELLVICDDVNVPFGKIRFSVNGGSGGQNGVKNIIESIGSDRFCRLRVGIGREDRGQNLTSFVLGKFSSTEETLLPSVLDCAAQILRVYLHRGREEAALVASRLDARQILSPEQYV